MMLYLSLKLTALMLWGNNMGMWDEFQKFMGMGQQDTQQVAAPSPTTEQPKQVTPDPVDSYLDKLKMAESSGVATAKAKTSSAAGHYQFIEGTWKDLIKKHGKQYTLEDRYDPVKSREIAKLHAEDNKKLLTKELGSEPTDTQLYAAHFLGTSGAKQFLKASPKKLAKDVVDKAQVRANRSIFFDSKTKKPRTVAQVYSVLQKKIGE
jgi:hypothetical protein